MKNMYRMLLATVLMIGFASLNAQNHQSNQVTVLDHQSHVSARASLNEQIDKTGMKPSRLTEQAFMLTIAPQGNWKEIQIVGPNGFNQRFYSDMGEEYVADVEEGSYIVCIKGEKTVEGTLYNCYLGYDVIVDQDTYLTPSIEEAQYKIHVDALDENGNPILEQSYMQESLEVWIQFARFGGFGISIYPPENGGPCQVYICCNEMSDSFCISANHTISVENQTTYFINSVHIGKLTGDLLLSNDPSELKTFLCYFNLKDDGVYRIGYNKYIVSEIDNHYAYSYVIFGTHTYNKSNPIRLITNNKISDPSVFYDTGYSTSKPFVSVYGSSNYNPVGYNEKITSIGIYMNAEDKWIIEPFLDFDFHANSKPMDFFDPMTPTPMAHHIDIGQPVYFGYRTPILYYQADNNNASSSIYGTDYLGGPMRFISDNGCVRTSDECAIMTIQANGNEIFNDSLWKFNDYFILPVNESCPISMEVTNDHLIDEGIVKANHTKIAFDLNRDDAMPPTLTVLRVLNEYGQENVYLPNYSNNNITFAAGDFEPHFFESLGFYDKMQYKGKPEVEVYYAVEGGEWMPLQYIEDETLFHVNYGNVFTINLSQLNTDAANHWIDLKFSLTDEAGNSQVQELRNVFFTGEQVSVNESIGPEHSVYPNPFNDEVHIRTTETINGEAHVNVYNVLGEKVYDKTVNCNGECELVIEGSHLKPGVYFYDIVAESGKIRGKIIKE